MAEEAGGFLSASEVSAIEGKTVQAIYKAIRERRLLCVEDPCGKMFPAVQFKGRAKERLPRILKAATSVEGWEMLHFRYSYPEGLAGKRPIDPLNGSEDDVALVERFARALAD